MSVLIPYTGRDAVIRAGTSAIEPRQRLRLPFAAFALLAMSIPMWAQSEIQALWVGTNSGAGMPQGAIVGGRDRDGVTPLYLCRVAVQQDEYLLGKAAASGVCWVPENGLVQPYGSYEVLTGESLHWVPATSVIQGAFSSPYNQGQAYICRGRPPVGVVPDNGTGLHPGMLYSNGTCEIAYGNSVYRPVNFEVLRNPWVRVQSLY
ncbi:MAG: DUF3421 domain-containing protein, partial [Bryobacterales bacterium]|nr:DUF3421 domain-containing protein [Bryobacterales bacterium]